MGQNIAEYVLVITSRKGGVISDLFAEQREAWVNVNWFLTK